MKSKITVMLVMVLLTVGIGETLVYSAEDVAPTESAAPSESAAGLSALPSGEAGEVVAAPPVIVHFHLSGTLTETPIEDPFGFMGTEVTSLKDLLRRMKQAREDQGVKAVVLTFDSMAMGLGQLEEIRRAMKELKDAEKSVYVHGEGMRMGGYALLSGATHLSIAPQSDLLLTGLYGESLYVKGLLDMIGVEADFMQIGPYKSAAEMVTRTGPSEAAAENINWLLDGLYDSLVDMISESRKKTKEEVLQLIDNGPYMAQAAKAAGLIDSVQFRGEFLAQIKKEYGDNVKFNNRYARKKGTAINFANPFAFFSILTEMFAPAKKISKDSVAIVFVEGMILPGYRKPSFFGTSQGAYSGDIRNALEKAAKDDRVKAVVLRVDSPGGSASASEVILNATRGVQAKKPLIVSMGNVAASGGYYVACQADMIFADETTITASIGVVGGKLVTTGMWDKLGINWVGYKRGSNADIFSSANRFSDSQRAALEKQMQQVYAAFTGHIVKARQGKLTKPIEEMAGGRVYTGKQALELGLIDQIGGLADAIEYGAAQASISDYDIRVIPSPKDFMKSMFEKMSGEGDRPTDISLGSSVSMAKMPMLRSLLPILSQLDPQRTSAVLRTLQRIELIRQDGVVLMMPDEIILY